MEVKRYSLTIGKQPAIAIDVENNILNLNGITDLTSGIKAALGY